MSLARRAGKGILWAQFGKLLDVALSFIFSIVVIRQLGPEGYGEYGIIMGLVGLGLFLAAMGFPEILGRHIPREQLKEDGGSTVFLLRWTLGWRAAIALAIAVFFVIFSAPIGNLFHLDDLQQICWLVAGLFLLQSLLALTLAFFAATLRMVSATVVNTIVWGSNLLLILLVIARTGTLGVDAVIITSALATGLGLLAALWLLRRVLGAPNHERLPTRPLWRYGSTVWLTGLASYGLDTQSDVLLLGMLLPDAAQVGLYKAAVMPVQRVMGLIFGGWAGLTMPVLAEAEERHGVAGIQRGWQTYIKLDVLLGIPVLVLIAATASTSLPLLYSESYVGAVVLLQLYALTKVPGFAVGHGLSTVVMQGHHMEGTALRLRATAAAMHIGLSLLLIPRWGAAGAIMAMGIAGATMWALETGIIKRKFTLDYPGDFLLKVLLASGFAWLAILPLPGGTWLWLMVQTAVFGGVLVLLLSLLKPLSAEDQRDLARMAPALRRLTGIFTVSDSPRGGVA